MQKLLGNIKLSEQTAPAMPEMKHADYMLTLTLAKPCFVWVSVISTGLTGSREKPVWEGGKASPDMEIKASSLCSAGPPPPVVVDFSPAAVTLLGGRLESHFV